MKVLGLKWGKDLEDRAAHLHQELAGVPLWAPVPFVSRGPFPRPINEMGGVCTHTKKIRKLSLRNS